MLDVHSPHMPRVQHKNYTTIAAFLYEFVCRWGAIEVIVTDNAPQYLQAVEQLAEKYHINHIRISPYNSHAQGPIEQWHYDVQEAIMKAAEGDESKWPDVAPAVLWAEQVTIQKYTGYSPDYLPHVVLGSPVQSSFCLSGRWTETETSPPKSQ